MERLSSGLRINRAGDDAAGLAISSSLRVSAAVTRQAVRNINDGISLLNVADGALQSLTYIAERQIELVTQAANGAYSVTQRRALHEEAEALTEEWNRIVQGTSFNGINLFQNVGGQVTLQVGPESSDYINLGIGALAGTPIGTTQFGASIALSPGLANIYSKSVGDVNEDGNVDILNYTRSSSVVVVSLGNGDGTFRAGVSYQVGAVDANLVVQSVLADLNGDGHLDYANPNSTDGTIAVLFGNGNGTFRAPALYSVPALTVTSLDTADYNGDGHLDLATNRGAGVSVMINNGDGTFRAPIISTLPLNALIVEAADINHDGRMDILSAASNRLMVMLGNGDGTFAYSEVQTGLTAGWGSETEDFNRDGILDVVITDYNFPAYSNRALVMFGNGDGTFHTPNTYYLTAAHDITVADINSDGLGDIVSRASFPGFEIMLANLDGTFRAAVTVVSAGQTWTLEAADFNEDGALDVTSEVGTHQYRLAVTSTSANAPYLYLLSEEGARESLETATGFLSRVSTARGVIGAQMSRLDVAARHLSATHLEYEAAASRITDADVAVEVSELVRSQILQQTVSGLLAAYKVDQQIVLRLLES